MKTFVIILVTLLILSAVYLELTNPLNTDKTDRSIEELTEYIRELKEQQAKAVKLLQKRVRESNEEIRKGVASLSSSDIDDDLNTELKLWRSEANPAGGSGTE